MAIEINKNRIENEFRKLSEKQRNRYSLYIPPAASFKSIEDYNEDPIIVNGAFHYEHPGDTVEDFIQVDIFFNPQQNNWFVSVSDHHGNQWGLEKVCPLAEIVKWAHKEFSKLKSASDY